MRPENSLLRISLMRPENPLLWISFMHSAVRIPGTALIHAGIPLLCVTFMLIFFSIQDLLQKAVSVKWAAGFAAAEMVLYAVLNRPFLPGCLPKTALSLLPGLFLYLFSLASGGGIGSGDAIVLLLTGILLSAGEVITLLLTGLMCSSVYAAFLLLRGKSRHASYPFIPFLLPGALLLFLRPFS